jgi:hypothetical protein
MSTLLVGTALTVLPLVGAGLLAAMVLLERKADTELAPAGRGSAPAKSRQRRSSRRTS